MTLSDSTNITERIYQEACVLFDHCWNHNPIRQLGVSTSHAVHSAYEQIHLFDSKKYDKLSRLNFAIDHIRSRYGEDAVQRACFIGSEHTHMTQGMSRAKRL